MSDENSPSKSFSIPEFRQSEASIAQKANVAEQMATQRSNEQVMRTERIGNDSGCPGGPVPADPTDARWEACRTPGRRKPSSAKRSAEQFMLSQIAKSLEEKFRDRIHLPVTIICAATRKSGPPAPLRMPPHARAILTALATALQTSNSCLPKAPSIACPRSRGWRGRRTRSVWHSLALRLQPRRRRAWMASLQSFSARTATQRAYGCDRVAALNEYAKLYYGL